MAVSKAWKSNPSNREAVVAMYRSSECLTCAKIAERLGTRSENVRAIVAECIPKAERKALASLKYSASKTGAKNPMYGKRCEEHHSWKGACEDGYGYLTIKYNGKRRFLHHVVMMKALGIQALPKWAVVHHIDGNPKNNDLENLALATKRGHQRIHYLQAKDSLAVALQKKSIAEALKYMTSP